MSDPDFEALRANVRRDMDEQFAVIDHNRRWLVRLRLVPRLPMPDPLWPRTLPPGQEGHTE